MKIESLAKAYAVYFTSDPDSDERMQALLYLLRYETPETKAELWQTIMENFPNVEAKFYDDEGEPYFNFNDVADALKIPKEDREHLREMFTEHTDKMKLHRKQ